MLQITEIARYYKTAFAYRRDFYFKSEGKIYSYAIMREMLDVYGEHNPKLFGIIKPIILGFDNVKNSRSGLNKWTLTRYFTKFRHDVLRFIKNQESLGPINPECPTAEKFYDCKDRAAKFKNRNLDQLGIKIYWVEGEKRITIGDLVKFIEQSSARNAILDKIDPHVDRNDLPQKKTQSISNKKQIIESVVYYLNRE